MAAQRPKKPTGSGGGSARTRPSSSKGLGAQGLMEAVAIAAEWLKNPEVQAQLLDVGMGFADKFKARPAGDPSNADSKRIARKRAPSGAAPRSLPAVAPQRRLERSTDKLAATVAMLRSAQGEASSEALDQVDIVIGRVRLALAVAKNLPARRRISRQREIAVALRQVEDALMVATGLSDLTDGGDAPVDPDMWEVDKAEQNDAPEAGESDTVDGGEATS